MKRNLAVAAFVVCCVVAQASVVSRVWASPAVFTIDPAQSFVAMSGSLDLDLGPLGSIVMLPLSSQIGSVPGVAGATIGDGTTSNGLRTTLTGTLFADVAAASIRFYSQHTMIQPAVSGSWQPAAPPSASPADAQLGAFVSTSGFAAPAAIRGSLYVLSSDPLALTGSGGIRHFSASEAFQPAQGFVDYGVSPLSRRAYLAELKQPNAGAPGTLESLGGGQERLTIPVSIPVALDSRFFKALPLSLDATLSGQIVATATVPESDAAWLGMVAIAVLVSLRSASRVQRKEWVLRLLCSGLLAAGCGAGLAGNPCTDASECNAGEFCNGDGYCMPNPQTAEVDPPACQGQDVFVSGPGASDEGTPCDDPGAINIAEGNGFEQFQSSEVVDPTTDGVQIYFESENNGNQDPAFPVSGDGSFGWVYHYTGALGDQFVLFQTPLLVGNVANLLFGADGSVHCGAGPLVTFHTSSDRVVADMPDGDGDCVVFANASMQTPGHGATTGEFAYQARDLQGCTSGGECPELHCVDGQCTNGAVGDKCATALDCGAGFICNAADSACSDGSAGRACEFGADCADGLSCDGTGHCQP